MQQLQVSQQQHGQRSVVMNLDFDINMWNTYTDQDATNSHVFATATCARVQLLHEATFQQTRHIIQLSSPTAQVVSGESTAVQLVLAS